MRVRATNWDNYLVRIIFPGQIFILVLRLCCKGFLLEVENILLEKVFMLKGIFYRKLWENGKSLKWPYSLILHRVKWTTARILNSLKKVFNNKREMINFFSSKKGPISFFLGEKLLYERLCSSVTHSVIALSVMLFKESLPLVKLWKIVQNEWYYDFCQTAQRM